VEALVKSAPTSRDPPRGPTTSRRPPREGVPEAGAAPSFTSFDPMREVVEPDHPLTHHIDEQATRRVVGQHRGSVDDGTRPAGQPKRILLHQALVEEIGATDRDPLEGTRFDSRRSQDVEASVWLDRKEAEDRCRARAASQDRAPP